MNRRICCQPQAHKDEGLVVKIGGASTCVIRVSGLRKEYRGKVRSPFGTCVLKDVLREIAKNPRERIVSAGGYCPACESIISFSVAVEGRR